MDYTAYFQKWPQKFSEMTIIKGIHKTVECAQHALKKDKSGTEHIKYMIEAYKRIQDYFRTKGIDPDQHT